MKKHVLLTTAAATGLAVAALASPAQAAPKTVASSRLAAVSSVPSIVKFWTANAGLRMKAAVPFGQEHKLVAKHVSVVPPAATGKAGVVPAIGDEKKSTAVSKNVNLPRTVGRVFFAVGNSLFSCSASSIQSVYHNMVATAGHCVYDLEGNAQVVDDWIFVPAYHDGKAPYGLFIGKQAFTHYDLDVFEDLDRDYAFVTVYNGVAEDPKKPGSFIDTGRLGDRVGGQGFAYNQKLGTKVFAFGYPAAAHPDGNLVFTGERMKWCYGKTVFPVQEPAAKVEEHLGLRCSMTGGSSGGPWILQYKNARRLGYINGVTSLGGDTDNNNRSDLITSPYFDGETFGVYKAGYNLWSGSVVKADGSIGITEARSE